METLNQRKKRIKELIDNQIKIYSESIEWSEEFITNDEGKTLEDYSNKLSYFLNEYNKFTKEKENNYNSLQELLPIIKNTPLNSPIHKDYKKELDKINKDALRLVNKEKELQQTFEKLEEYKPIVKKYRDSLKEFYFKRDEINADGVLKYTNFINTLETDNKEQYIRGDIDLSLDIVLNNENYVNYLRIDKSILGESAKNIKNIDDCQILFEENKNKIIDYLTDMAINLLYPMIVTYGKLNEQDYKKTSDLLLNFISKYLEENKSKLFNYWLNLKNNIEDKKYLSYVTNEIRILTLSAGRKQKITEANLMVPSTITSVGNVNIIQEITERNIRVKRYGIKADKLFKYLLVEFAKVNELHTKKYQKELVIDLIEYGKLLGKKVKEEVLGENATKQDLEKEKNRAKAVRNNVSKEVKEGLSILGSKLTFENADNGNEFCILNILEFGKVKNNKAKVRFTDTFCEYILNGTTQKTFLNELIFSLDCRKETEYFLACKLQENYEMSNNVKRKTNNVLKVKSILNSLNLKSYEEWEKEKRGSEWRSLIKDQLEDALEGIYQHGILLKYDYVKENKRKLTKEETNMLDETNDYYYWENLYIKYELNNLYNKNGKNYKTKKKAKTKI